MLLKHLSRKSCFLRAPAAVRLFSSTPEPPQDDDELDFPYTFLNEDDLIRPTGKCEPSLLKEMTAFVHLHQEGATKEEDYPRLKNFFALGYITLLDAIARGDRG